MRSEFDIEFSPHPDSLTENASFEFNRLTAPFVITGLDPVIQDRAWGKCCLDCRIKSGNDDMGRPSFKALSSLMVFPTSP